MSKSRLYNIDFLRFLFAVTIVYFHILHDNIIPYIDENETYILLRELSYDAYTIVECFFIMSGYFLFQTKNVSIPKFIIKRCIRLWPVLFFSIIVGVAFFQQGKVIAIINSFFLQCIGVSLDYKGINWYISPLFWGSILIFTVTKCFDDRKAALFIGILSYFGYVLNINITHGGFGRATFFGVVNLGLARAIAGIGLGYLIGVILEEIKNMNFYYRGEGIKNKLSVNLCYFAVCKTAVCTFVETGCLIYLAGFFVFGINNRNQIIVVILFVLLFLSFIFKGGILSKVLNHPFLGNVGKYAYSIYVMQQIGFWILQRTIWKTAIINHVSFCLIISTLFCVILGIITYYAIEKPFSRIGSKFEIETR